MHGVLPLQTIAKEQVRVSSLLDFHKRVVLYIWY